MKNLILFISLLFLIACKSETTTQKGKVVSPDGNVSLQFFLTKDGAAGYTVQFKGKTVIDTSLMGFVFKDAKPLKTGLEQVDSKYDSFKETWKMQWGEQEEVINNYNEFSVSLKENGEAARLVNLRFRVYDDGLGFRYEFPEQAHLKDVVIMEEQTEFQMTGDHMSWWIPGDWDIYEHVYTTSKLSEVDGTSKRNMPWLAQTYIPDAQAVSTPFTMRTSDGLHLSIHEAALVDYSGMTIHVDHDDYKLTSALVGSPDDSKVKIKTPFKTPWRTIQIGETAGDLIESNLIVNLNEPNKLGNVSWFKPMKYTGIWWEMHLNKSSWDLKSGKHGATTENAKAFIDFSAKNNIGGVLVEGWNIGWEHWIGFEDREGVFDFITPYPDYDIEEVVKYGKEKGVDIVMHHETSAAPRTYEQQMDTAYALMQRLGIHTVKSGYVGKIIPKGQYHHGQWMINHYNNAVKKAAKYQVAVNAHEPIKATGLRRTYPNIISREGMRGQEFNAWAGDGGNPPEHLPIVAFTRMLSGPFDFTPGIFDIKLDKYKPDNQINTTIAQQLALYVVIYSPVQMAADLIENYEGNPAFQFIRDVGVDWQQSKVLNGEVGDFVTIARKEKKSDKWFIGSITDEEKRSLDIDLSFLDEDKKYTATFYEDAADAHYSNNPTAITINKYIVDHNSKLKLKLVEGGGAAISLITATEDEIKSLKTIGK